MKFSDLSNYFDQLESTSSRLALIDILAELFSKTDTTIIDKVMYLMQGRVAPFYAPVEFGMADKMVAQSIGDAFGLSKQEISKSYSEKGDMGVVVFDLMTKQHLQGNLFQNSKKELSVVEVFARLSASLNLISRGNRNA